LDSSSGAAATAIDLPEAVVDLDDAAAGPIAQDVRTKYS
jgi:hypothetical protein